MAGDHADGLPGRGWGCGGAALGFLAPAPRRVQRVLRDPVGAAAPVPPAVTSRWGTGPRSSGGGPGSCPGQGGCWPSSDSAACPPCDPALCALRPGYLPPSERARRRGGSAGWRAGLLPCAGRIYWVKLEAVRDPRPAFRCLLGSSLISSYLTFLNTWQCRKARSRRSFLRAKHVKGQGDCAVL